MMTVLFELVDGACGYGKKQVLHDVQFAVDSGEVMCILGANGAGKTTLFKSILGLLPMQAGALRINGEDIGQWPRARVAQSIGYVPQSSNPPFSYTVMDVVLMGRTAYLKSYQSPREADEEIAVAVIERLGITRLMGRRYLELSGGEKQLVLIARALTQQPEILVMDEPTTGLDFGNQQLVLEQVHLLAHEGLAVVMSSHFPDHAFLYGDQALMLRDGTVYALGSPREVITETSMDELYEVQTKIIATGLRSKRVGTEIQTCIPLN
ncbi:MAG: ABC transporter ATP-binding protein [Beutenbergiaceae bacterium]